MSGLDALAEMLAVCGCEHCPQRKKCNVGVDLVNCYATKKLLISRKM
jgi:hypothetical protein